MRANREQFTKDNAMMVFRPAAMMSRVCELRAKMTWRNEGDSKEPVRLACALESRYSDFESYLLIRTTNRSLRKWYDDEMLSEFKCCSMYGASALAGGW